MDHHKKAHGDLIMVFGYKTIHVKLPLRWLKTVSNTYIWIGRYNHCLSFDATIMVSKNYPIISEQVVIIFLTQ